MTADQPGPTDVLVVLGALRELCQWCEHAVAGWQNPAVLARLLEQSGRLFHLAEDFRHAARLWTRAAEINRDRIQHAADDAELAQARVDLAAILQALSWHHQQLKRPHRAIDAERELVAVYQAVGDKLATARTLAQAGSTLLGAARYTEALHYLNRADLAFQPLGSANHMVARAHARALNHLALAHRHHDDPAEARRCERRAAELAAVPLAPAVSEVHELKTTVTNMLGQLTSLAEQVTTLTDQVNKDRPTPDQLAKIPDVAGSWLATAAFLTSLTARLVKQVDTIAEAAGHATTKPTQTTPLDALHELVEWVAQAAITRRAPALLIGLLDRAAQVYRLAGDFPRAEEQWVQALKIAQELAHRADDADSEASARAHSIRILQSRSELYHSWSRPDAASDIDLALVDAHRAAGDAPGHARALARLGATMVSASRYDSAERYLTEADTAFQALGELDTAMASAHASTLELSLPCTSSKAMPSRPPAASAGPVPCAHSIPIRRVSRDQLRPRIVPATGFVPTYSTGPRPPPAARDEASTYWLACIVAVQVGC